MCCKYLFPVYDLSFGFAYGSFLHATFSLKVLCCYWQTCQSFIPSWFWVIERLSLYTIYKWICPRFTLVFIWLHFFSWLFFSFFLQLEVWPIWSSWWCTVYSMCPTSYLPNDYLGVPTQLIKSLSFQIKRNGPSSHQKT